METPRVPMIRASFPRSGDANSCQVCQVKCPRVSVRGMANALGTERRPSEQRRGGELTRVDAALRSRCQPCVGVGFYLHFTDRAPRGQGPAVGCQLQEAKPGGGSRQFGLVTPSSSSLIRKGEESSKGKWGKHKHIQGRGSSRPELHVAEKEVNSQGR